MSLKQYMILMAIGSAIGWGAWILILFSTNPFEAGFLGFVLFYLALFIALVGTMSLLGFIVRLWILKREEVVLRQVTTAFRQSILLSVLVAGSLYLQSRGVLAWWNIIIFIIVLGLIELFYISTRYSKL